jgi:formiminotetrahydrofolate cyclodeaminase
MTLIDQSVAELLAAFQSPVPTPGGGSASALAGAIGASLVAMVAGLPTSRATTTEDHARLEGARRRCLELASELTALVDRDSDAYELVVRAYRRPKATDEEKTARSAAIQEALRVAIAAPLDVMRACAAAIGQAPIVSSLGNASASSDVLVGVELLRAALRGARLNVEINLETVKDPAYAKGIREELAQLDPGNTGN